MKKRKSEPVSCPKCWSRDYVVHKIPYPELFECNNCGHKFREKECDKCIHCDSTNLGYVWIPFWMDNVRLTWKGIIRNILHGDWGRRLRFRLCCNCGNIYYQRKSTYDEHRIRAVIEQQHIPNYGDIEGL